MFCSVSAAAIALSSLTLTLYKNTCVSALRRHVSSSILTFLQFTRVIIEKGEQNKQKAMLIFLILSHSLSQSETEESLAG